MPANSYGGVPKATTARPWRFNGVNTVVNEDAVARPVNLVSLTIPLNKNTAETNLPHLDDSRIFIASACDQSYSRNLGAMAGLALAGMADVQETIRSLGSGVVSFNLSHRFAVFFTTARWAALLSFRFLLRSLFASLLFSLFLSACVCSANSLCFRCSAHSASFAIVALLRVAMSRCIVSSTV